jgi:hypothetical protein
MRSKSEIINSIKDITITMAKQYHGKFNQVATTEACRIEHLITLCSINQSLMTIAEVLIDIRDNQVNSKEKNNES